MLKNIYDIIYALYLDFRDHIFIGFLYSFISLIIFRKFLNVPQYPVGIDSFPPISLISYLGSASNSLSLWESTYIGSQTPITVYHIMSLFPVDANIIFKAFLILSTIVACFGMYLFIYSETNSRLGAFIAGLIFIYNQWIISKIVSGHLLHVLAYCLVPFLFIYVKRIVRGNRFRDLLLFSILLSLLPLFRLDPIIYVLPFLSLYALFLIFDSKQLYIIKKVLIVFVLFLILTCYIWVPLLVVGNPALSSISFTLDSVGGFSIGLIHAFLGQGRQMSYLFWLGDIGLNIHPFLPLYGYRFVMLVIPLTAFLSLFFVRDKMAILFSLFALVSVFLAKGYTPPLEILYQFLFNNIPFFDRLRAPDRWLMITWFAYSYLVGIFLSAINKEGQFPKYLRKTYTIVLIFLILSTLILSTPYVFIHGYKTYQFPEQEVEVHNTLDNGGFERVATIPYGYARMWNFNNGIEADLGSKSGRFSSHPVFFIPPKYDSTSATFFEYSMYLVENRLTNKLIKILGIYDVRYLVLQGYPANAPSPFYGLIIKPTYKQHNFFQNQSGLNTVYSGNPQRYSMYIGDTWLGALIKNSEEPKLNKYVVSRPPMAYENKYWIPRIFSPGNQILALGGLDTFRMLAEEDLHFENINLFFADHLSKRNYLIKQINRSDNLIFTNTQPIDLGMLISNSTWIKAREYANTSGWYRDDLPIVRGFFAYNRDVVSARENGAKIVYRFDTSGNSEYELWIRPFLHTSGGDLKVNLDGQEVDTLNTYEDHNLGFKWVKLGEVRLDTGVHELTVVNEGGANSLNGIVVAERGAVDKALREVEGLIDGKSVYLVDRDKLEKIGVDPLELLEQDVIFDDQWVNSHEWSPSFPADVEISDSRQSLSGSSSLKIDVTPRPRPGELASKSFLTTQNWEEAKYISFWFKGTGSGEPFNLWIYFNDSSWPNPDVVRYGPFHDTSTEWRQITIPLDRPADTFGTSQWDKVSRIVLANPHEDLSGTFYLDRFSIHRGEIKQEDLESRLGAEVVLYSNGKPQGDIPFEVNENSSAVESLDFEKISPSKWTVRVNSTAPYTLVFSNTYHPMWRAYVNGTEYESIPSYYFINSFQINETGEHEVTIEFIGQRIQNISLAVSGLAYLGCFGYLFYDWRRD